MNLRDHLMATTAGNMPAWPMTPLGGIPDFGGFTRLLFGEAVWPVSVAAMWSDPVWDEPWAGKTADQILADITEFKIKHQMPMLDRPWWETEGK